MHYRDLENFDNELKEQKILEFEKDHKRHLIELEKLKNARKELELESKQQFLKGLRPFIWIIAICFGMGLFFILLKFFKKNYDDAGSNDCTLVTNKKA